MSRKEIRNKLRDLINTEKDQIKHIQELIDRETPSISNHKYLRLLAVVSYHSNRLDQLEEKYKLVRRRNMVKAVFVGANSKVKLVSTKIGATLWVDARNYVELLGKTIGDTVMMHNSQFEIAGIY